MSVCLRLGCNGGITVLVSTSMYEIMYSWLINYIVTLELDGFLVSTKSS